MPLPRFEPSRPRSSTCIRSKSRPLGYSPFNDPGFLLNRRNLKEKKYSAFWRFSVCLDRWYKSTPYNLNILHRLISYINVQDFLHFYFLLRFPDGIFLTGLRAPRPSFSVSQCLLFIFLLLAFSICVFPLFLLALCICFHTFYILHFTF